MKKFLIILLGVITAFITFFFIRVNSFYNNINTRSGSVFIKPTTPPEKSVYTILLLGYGGAGHEGAYLTDTIMIAQVDLKKKKVSLISLPRDIWVKVPTKSKEDFHMKINSVYQMGLFNDNYPDLDERYSGKQGAAELSKEVIAQVIGFPIDNYIAIDFTGFKKVVDTIGGIEVNVERSFDDYEYPITGKEDDTCDKKDKDLEDALKLATESAREAFPCRYEHLHFDKGTQHMDGERALKYARSRHSLQDGTDYGRAARQQKVIEAVKEKMISIGFIPKVLPLMNELQNYLRLDIELNDIQKFIAEAQKDSNYKIIQVVPTNGKQFKNSLGAGGQFILIPQEGEDEWSEIHRWIKNTINEITPTPTPLPATPSAKLKPTTSR